MNAGAVSLNSRGEKNKRPVPDIGSLIASFSFLPPAFELVPRLLLLLDDAEANCEDFAEMIRIDPGLTANVLRIAQSALYGGAQRIVSLSEAIMRLAVREVYRLVTEIITSPALKMADGFAFGRVDLWRHSLATAVAAEMLCRQLTNEDAEAVFSAALLHDLGKPLLGRAMGREYFALLKRCAEENRSVHEAEQEEFQLNHAEVAGRLLRSWKFPDSIVAAVAGHHFATAANHSEASALVYAGNILAYRTGQGNGYPIHAGSPDPAILAVIGLDEEALWKFEDEVSEKVKHEQERLR